MQKKEPNRGLAVIHPWEWLASYFSFQYHPMSHTYKGHENKGSDHLLKKLLIVKQVLLVSALKMYWEQYGEYAK